MNEIKGVLMCQIQFKSQNKKKNTYEKFEQKRKPWMTFHDLKVQYVRNGHLENSLCKQQAHHQNSC